MPFLSRTGKPAERRPGTPIRLSELIGGGVRVPDDAKNLMISSIALDSRKAESGALFAALPGSAQHGIAFAPTAIEQGAVAVLTDLAARESGIDVPIVRTSDPRRALARAAATFFVAQPENIVAVTGTNGKTSVASFLRQIWTAAGLQAASLGTIGLDAPGRTLEGTLTTPDTVSLHALLADLAGDGVTHMAMEASSHGLDQRRLDGCRLAAGAFTNLSRDHLDYHGTVEAYLKAKMRLFSDLLPHGAAAVIDADTSRAGEVAALSRQRGLKVVTVGRKGEALRLVSLTRMPDGSRMTLEAGGAKHYVKLPLVGGFQASNALVAAALAIATGVETGDAIAALGRLRGAKGRMDIVGKTPAGGTIYVDYSHTPDAIATALAALREHVPGRIVAVVGAGGDRDPGKRPLMGEAAASGADAVIVTDDNPRSEDPAAIRREVLDGAPRAAEVGNRSDAIRGGAAMLGAGDALLIAGKGHETGQTIGDVTHPFSDHEEALAAIAELERNAA